MALAGLSIESYRILLRILVVGFITYIARNTQSDDVIILLTNKMVGIELKELKEIVFSSLDADFGEFQ